MSPPRQLSAWLERHGVLVGDGGMGTMLQEAGLGPGACPELWNVERPDDVAAVSRRYAEAGAQLVQTNTFGGSPQKLAAYGLQDRCGELNRAGAALARRGAADKALVVGSMGPTGKLLEPFGELTEAGALEGFGRQARALRDGGADVLCVETMIDLQEALLALRAARETGLPVMVTLTFEETPRGFFTVMGADIPSSARALAEGGAAAVGTNCGVGPETMIEMVRTFRAQTSLPILVQPNAGLPVVRASGVHYPQTAEDMARHVRPFVETGATIIGGCCGTTPGHVAALRAAVSSLRGP